MKTIFIIFLFLLILSLIFFGIIGISLYIHKNMKGSKIWNFVNKHIITDEDEYIKNN
jgi:hypothetical protein